MRSSMKWTFGLTAANLAATAALFLILDRLIVAAFWSANRGGLTVELAHLARELMTTSLMLLHLPLVLAMEVFGERVVAQNPVIFLIYAAVDAFVQAACLAIIIQFWRRPTGRLAHRSRPYLNRQVLGWGFTLALGYLSMSAVLYVMARLAVGGIGPPIAYRFAWNSLRVLHPWVLGHRLLPHQIIDGDELIGVIVDSLVWGFVVAWGVVWIQRNCWGQRREEYSQAT